MAQDYYFNSHNPNNSNNGGATPPPKKPSDKKPQKQGQNQGAPNVRRPASAASGAHPSKNGQGRPDGRRKQTPANASVPQGESKGLSKTKMNLLKVVFGSLIVGAVTCFVVGLTVLIYSINTVNGDVILNLDTAKYEQAQTTFIYGKDEAGQEIELSRLHGTENRIWVDMENMSPYMKEAFIALEDKRFEKHNGVDWFRTLSAIIVHGGSQGGSTITQQLIKNLTDQKSVTFVRKFNEILSALNLEKHYEKDEIIEAYLNTIFLSQGCYGVETASITYFGKDISELNLAECASLAAITQFPSKYDPLRATRTVTSEDGTEKVNDYVQNNKARQIMCLDNMLDQGKITQAQYDEAVNYKLVFTNSPDYTGKSEAASAKTDQSKKEGQFNSYYVDFVIQQVAEKIAAKEGITLKKAQRMVNSGGYKIYAAMDYTVQSILEDAYENYAKMQDKTAQSSMAILDYHGRVAGIVGGVGEKTGDMVLNRATQSPRPPGSTIKPLAIYAPALELNNIWWSKLYADSPSRKSEEEPMLKGSGWPKNDHNVGGNGAKVTVQYALSQSLNTVPVRILDEIQFENGYKFITEKAHLSSASDSDLAYGPLALGSLTKGATSLEMAAAYQMFGNGGYYYEPYAFTKVVNSRNEIVFEVNAEKTRQQTLSPANATVMNKLLQTVATSNGTGAPYALESSYETFAKTGTTSGSKDRWFVAGSPYYVGAVWYGYDDPKTIVSDGNPAGYIWKYVMAKVHSAKQLAGQKFEVSSDAVQRKYCTETGLLAGNSCYNTAYGWYDSNNLPNYCNNKHSGASSSGESSSTGSAATTNSAGGENSGGEAKTEPPATTPPATEPATTSPNSGAGQPTSAAGANQ